MTKEEKALLITICKSSVNKYAAKNKVNFHFLAISDSTFNKYWRLFGRDRIPNKYICLSIKHSMHGHGWWFWCSNFSGYTGDIENAGLYTPEDFKQHYAIDFPVVKMTADICKKYKKYDSVLVDKCDFIRYTNDLKNCKDDYQIDNIKGILHGLQCILTAQTIEPSIRIEKALARIREIRGSN